MSRRMKYRYVQNTYSPASRIYRFLSPVAENRDRWLAASQELSRLKVDVEPDQGGHALASWREIELFTYINLFPELLPQS
jgi:hypothetical protein